MDWKEMMSKCILLIVVITLLIVDDSVGSQNVSLTSISLSEEQKKEIVVRHNVLRSREGSSNMLRLIWVTFLASAAETWAAKCLWEPGHLEHGITAQYDTVGQNLYAGTHSTINLASVIRAWYDEKQDFNYDTSECALGKMCGNYTGMVWATTLEIGCALHQCEPLMEKKDGKEIVKYRKALYLACNYGPAGNLKSVATGKLLTPFFKGKFCSNCRSGAGWCKHRLCNIECSRPGPDCNCSAICYNCATLNLTTCRCKCAAGWRGVGCTERCTNKDQYCTPDPYADEGACPPVYGPHADKSASTSLMKSHHVMMMMMFVMITTITVSISNRDAAL